MGLTVTDINTLIVEMLSFQKSWYLLTIESVICLILRFNLNSNYKRLAIYITGTITLLYSKVVWNYKQNIQHNIETVRERKRKKTGESVRKKIEFDIVFTDLTIIIYSLPNCKKYI